MIARTVSTRRGSLIGMLGSNSMSTETKNSTENESRSGKDSSAARWLSSDSRSTMPAKNAPSANDTPKSPADPYAIPTAAAITHSMKSSREPVRATCQSSHGKTRLPITSMNATKSATRPSVIAIGDERGWSGAADASPPSHGENAGTARARAPSRGLRRPAIDRDAAIQALDRAAALERAQQHDGARDGQRQAEDERAADLPAPGEGDQCAERGRDGDLHEGARQRDLAHSKQVLHREVQPDAEHQQHHADLRELLRELHVGDEARSSGADEDARNEVAHERGQLELHRDETEHERDAERRGDGRDQPNVMRHVPVLGAAREGRGALRCAPISRRFADAAFATRPRDPER
jgi:hypothetical protein